MKSNKFLTKFLMFIFILLIISVFLMVLNKNIFLFLQTLFIAPFTIEGGLIFNSVAVKIVPIIFTALSLTVAFKTGLFNIGAEGQFCMGLFASLILGSIPGIPTVLHFIIILLGSFILGALWGIIPAILKTKFKVHEVVSGIMLNYISLYLMKGYLLPLISDPLTNNKQTKVLAESAKLTDIIPNNDIFGISYINIFYILIALIFIIIIKYLLDNTVLGYKIKASGSNSVCSEYSGINVNKNILISMIIAGGLAGIGGVFYSFSVKQIYTTSFIMLGYGFDGLTATLIGGGTVFGTIIGSFLLSYFSAINLILQQVLEVPREIVDIISSLILYFIAIKYGFQILVRKILNFKKNNNINKE